MSDFFEIGNKLSIESIARIITEGKRIELSAEAKEKILKARTYLDNKVKGNQNLFYGINTGFGSLCNTRVEGHQLEDLQTNLVISHACGTGNYVPIDIVRLMLLLKIQSLSYGNSGVQLDTVWRLTDMYNLEVSPVVYEQGSLGASGDLAPLAHLSLPLLGLGEVWFKGTKISSEQILKALKLNAINLQSKEGLALLNGTQFMSAYGVYCLLQANRLSKWAACIAAISADAFDAKTEPFDSRIHKLRPHMGQQTAAAEMLQWLKGSEIANSEKKHVQDPYSFRCVPQVHGASLDVIETVTKVFETEINSVTDNPNVFPEDDVILSGGNFHGQTLALHLDFLAMGLAELGNISERRTYQLISGQRGLPPFLSPDAGLNSGFMIPQYTAASVVSQNKQLCSPSSIDSIVSSNGQEDHVSMGANAATKCLRVVNNLVTILAIELFTAAQALEFRRPQKSSPQIEKVISKYREKVPFLSKDALMHDYIQQSITFITTYLPNENS